MSREATYNLKQPAISAYHQQTDPLSGEATYILPSSAILALAVTRCFIRGTTYHLERPEVSACHLRQVHYQGKSLTS